MLSTDLRLIRAVDRFSDAQIDSVHVVQDDTFLIACCEIETFYVVQSVCQLVQVATLRGLVGRDALPFRNGLQLSCEWLRNDLEPCWRPRDTYVPGIAALL